MECLYVSCSSLSSFSSSVYTSLDFQCFQFSVLIYILNDCEYSASSHPIFPNCPSLSHRPYQTTWQADWCVYANLPKQKKIIDSVVRDLIQRLYNMYSKRGIRIKYTHTHTQVAHSASWYKILQILSQRKHVHSNPLNYWFFSVYGVIGMRCCFFFSANFNKNALQPNRPDHFPAKTATEPQRENPYEQNCAERF